MAAPKIILDRVKAFQADYNRYMSSDYKEARVRIEFIDPFLEALGWHPGTSEYIDDWRDCLVEQTIEVNEDKQKQRADYTCRLGRNPVMMVEAKKPSEHPFGRPKFARQVRLYAYSSPEVSLAVLTSFEELAIYNGRAVVRKDDDTEEALIGKYRFTDYIDKWDEIELLLSKRTIMTLQHREALQARPVRGLIPLDQTVLTEIEGWREDLAFSVARQNRSRLLKKELSAGDINLAVGRTIDRLLFLRVAEAKGIEPFNQLGKIAGGANIYDKLKKLFHEADHRYNSGLFYFKKEEGRHEQPDTLTLSLEIESEPLKQIIVGMYEPENRFEYSYIPIEILGQVYEQFLGNVITLDSDLKASVVPKPELKKARGVYYTPSYVVDFIVKSVLDPLLQGKTPKEIANMRILDPACGSGSFLLGAYQHLLNWYRLYYIKDGPSKHQKEIAPDSVEDFALTLHARKRILLSHIFGVDIDAQAVEVAKLSLLLKVLEGETRDTVETEFKRHKHALPDLGDNIKWGNSLVDSGISSQFPNLSVEECDRINPFDWNKDRDFGPILQCGGFDAVIGNPPWVDIKGMDPTLVEYYFSRYDTTQNRMNIYATFMHKSLELMNNVGQFGFITPASYLTQSSYKLLRKRILERYHPSVIVRLPDKVFSGVIAESAISIISGKGNKACKVLIYPPDINITRIDERDTSSVCDVKTDSWISNPDFVFDIHSSEEAKAIIEKVETCGTHLESLCDFSLGITPYDKYKGHTPKQIKTRAFHADYKKDNTYRPLLSGASISRYKVVFSGNQWISYGKWLGAPREERFFTEPRILVRQIISGKPGRIYAAYTDEEYCNTQIAFNVLKKVDSNVSLLYILGILNSRLISFYHRSRFLDSQKHVFQKILIQDAKRIPIYKINIKEKKDKEIHANIVKLVERIMKLEIKYGTSFWDIEKVERQIAATEELLDQFIYKLYGLTEEEIAIVEGGEKKT